MEALRSREAAIPEAKKGGASTFSERLTGTTAFMAGWYLGAYMNPIPVSLTQAATLCRSNGDARANKTVILTRALQGHNAVTRQSPRQSPPHFRPELNRHAQGLNHVRGPAEGGHRAVPVLEEPNKGKDVRGGSGDL